MVKSVLYDLARCLCVYMNQLFGKVMDVFVSGVKDIFVFDTTWGQGLVTKSIEFEGVLEILSLVVGLMGVE